MVYFYYVKQFVSLHFKLYYKYMKYMFLDFKDRVICLYMLLYDKYTNLSNKVIYGILTGLYKIDMGNTHALYEYNEYNTHTGVSIGTSITDAYGSIGEPIEDISKIRIGDTILCLDDEILYDIVDAVYVKNEDIDMDDWLFILREKDKKKKNSDDRVEVYGTDMVKGTKGRYILIRDI